MTALKFINLPPVKWKDAVDAMSSSERASLLLGIESIAMQSALALGYIDRRYASLSHESDSGHERGVKKANACLVALRNAFGYSYPEAGKINF